MNWLNKLTRIKWKVSRCYEQLTIGKRQIFFQNIVTKRMGKLKKFAHFLIALLRNDACLLFY